MRRALALVLLLALPAIAGCTSPSKVTISGVAPASDGAINLTAGPGLVVTPSAENHTILVGVAPVLQAQVVQACAGPCRNLTVNPGALIADGDVVGLGNVSLIASSTVADPALNFYDANLSTRQFFRWSAADHAFEASADVVAAGNVTATRFLSTRTILVTSTGLTFTVSTSPTEGNEVTIFARGNGTLRNGTATIDLPQPFQALEGNGTITVQVTLTSDGPGLYVSEKARDHFVVRATSGAPASDATFDWFVQAPRKGGEDFVV